MLSVTSWPTTSRSSGAEREAPGDLLAPTGEARQQQVGDVRAGDQKHAADRPEQHQIAATLLTHGIVEDRHHLDLRGGIHVRRVRRAVAGGDDVHGLASLDQGKARPQPRDCLKKVTAVVQLRGREKGHLGGPWHPDLKRIQGKGRDSLRQDADDGVRCAVQCQRLSQNRRVAVEALLPEAMADEHHLLASRPVLVCREIAPQQGLHPQRGQQRGGGVKPDELGRVASSGQRECIPH